MGLDFVYGASTAFGLISMRALYTILSLAPAPLFFLGFVWSVYSPSPHCGHDFQMPAMWLIMSLAHCLPWLLRWQQKNLTRN